MESKSSYLFETVSFEHVKIIGTILKKLQIPKLDIIKVKSLKVDGIITDFPEKI